MTAINKPTARQEEPSYQLVWSDEFDIDGPPDSTKWVYDSGFVRNEEAQWYQRQNAMCAGGQLVIKGQKEHKPNPNHVPGSKNWKTGREFIEFTSACLKMRKELAFQYGKMEVRAKIDAQTGLWPAIWTLGVSGEWPSNGEVDLMEYYDDKILANFAHADKDRYKAIWDSEKRPLASFGGATWAAQYHDWVLEWDEDKMQILLDGQLMNSIDLSTTINRSDGKNPFHQPHYALLDLAMGGQRGGDLTKTQLPSRFLVDHIRIYQKR